MNLSIVLFIIAFIVFVVEAVRGRSWLAAGLALFALAHTLSGVTFKAG